MSYRLDYRQALRGRLEALLGDLGCTPDGVANVLFAGGYTGTPGHSEQCPIANYLRDKAQLHEDLSVLVLPERAEIQDQAGFGVTAVALPIPVWQFIRRFDEARYEDLIRPKDEL